MLSIGYDWTSFYDPKDFKKEFGYEYDGLGWYEDCQDTLLVLDLKIKLGKQKGKVQVYCWNYSGARGELIKNIAIVAGMDVKVIKKNEYKKNEYN